MRYLTLHEYDALPKTRWNVDGQQVARILGPEIFDYNVKNSFEGKRLDRFAEELRAYLERSEGQIWHLEEVERPGFYAFGTLDFWGELEIDPGLNVPDPRDERREGLDRKADEIATAFLAHYEGMAAPPSEEGLPIRLPEDLIGDSNEVEYLRQGVGIRLDRKGYVGMVVGLGTDIRYRIYRKPIQVRKPEGS